MSHSSNSAVAINIDDGAETHETVEFVSKSTSHDDGHHDHSKCKGHHHGHGHGHGGHGHKHRHKHNWLQGRGLEIKLFVYGMLIGGWAVVIFVRVTLTLYLRFHRVFMHL